MISRGVEISITRGGGEIVRAYLMVVLCISHFLFL